MLDHAGVAAAGGGGGIIVGPRSGDETAVRTGATPSAYGESNAGWLTPYQALERQRRRQCLYELSEERLQRSAQREGDNLLASGARHSLTTIPRVDISARDATSSRRAGQGYTRRPAAGLLLVARAWKPAEASCVRRGRARDSDGGASPENGPSIFSTSEAAVSPRPDSRLSIVKLSFTYDS